MYTLHSLLEWGLGVLVTLGGIGVCVLAIQSVYRAYGDSHTHQD